MFSKLFHRFVLAETIWSRCKDGHKHICGRWRNSNFNNCRVNAFYHHTSGRLLQRSYIKTSNGAGLYSGFNTVGRRLLSTDIESYYDQNLLLDYVKDAVSGYSHNSEINNRDKLLEVYNEYEKMAQDIQELKSLQSGLSSEGSEMEALVQEEEDCKKKESNLVEQMVELVLPPTPVYNDIVMEIQSAIGGRESMLFAYEIYDMYKNLAFIRGWTFIETLERGDMMGHKMQKNSIRSAHICMSGYNIYGEMKYEGGIHRVQRIPETDTSDRMHTSTVIVTVFPQPQEVNIEIDPKELKIDTFRSSGPGGQNVNKNDTAVRVTHMPTGVKAECQTEKSQHHNRNYAIQAIKERLYQMEFDKQLMEAQRSRKIQIGTATFSDKIRTYNFQRDQVTDHRIHYSTHNIPEFFSGGEPLQNMMNIIHERSKYEILNEILEAYQKDKSLKAMKG